MYNDFLNQIRLSHKVPLDPHFKPAILFYRQYQKICTERSTAEIQLALKRSEHNIYRHDLTILTDSCYGDITEKYIELNLKFLLWSVGGYELYFSGPEVWYQKIKHLFSSEGKRVFDAKFMSRIYERSWQVTYCKTNELPKAKNLTSKLGGNLDGYRIGFDLGASDYKLAAVKNGETIFTTEIRWDPVSQSDPEYHWKRIAEGLELAASHLPRVDAIGGSSAGIIHENRIMVASLFRSVPDKDFFDKVTPIFNKLKEKWKVPFITVNDGDVSALAGSLGTKEKGILGIAMGSSEAVGFLNQQGEITGQLNELAFAPIDYNPAAAVDEWSDGSGAGVMYFSQQAVNRLALDLGLEFGEEMLLPERLKVVQKKMNEGDLEVAKIFETIGVYLGYTLPFYAQFYDFNKLMVFGRVMSGRGGDKIIETAQQVLDSEFPQIAGQMQLAIPDEKFRRVGQAVAAASLPEIT